MPLQWKKGQTSIGFIEAELSEGTGAEEKTSDCSTEQPFPNMVSAQRATIQAFPKLKIRKKKLKAKWASSHADIALFSLLTSRL